MLLEVSKHTTQAHSQSDWPGSVTPPHPYPSLPKHMMLSSDSTVVRDTARRFFHVNPEYSDVAIILELLHNDEWDLLRKNIDEHFPALSLSREQTRTANQWVLLPIRWQCSSCAHFLRWVTSFLRDRRGS